MRRHLVRMHEQCSQSSRILRILEVHTIHRIPKILFTFLSLPTHPSGGEAVVAKYCSRTSREPEQMQRWCSSTSSQSVYDKARVPRMAFRKV
jgi:hypothetical protein